MLQNHSFQTVNKDTYPPFKNGLYLEEYFLKYVMENNIDFNKKRKYIPVLWTNFQIENWFQEKKQEMQVFLDEWISKNPSNEYGYFTVAQHDDGPLLQLPSNTIVYGACSGNIPIPLIYQDVTNTLINIPKLSFSNKTILCSFVGNITSNHIQPNVRQTIIDTFQNNNNFLLYNSGGWSSTVNVDLQKKYVNITRISKFALSPRGYGRSSFRFFECFQLGTIPIYVWNDIEWLPFKEIIDYEKLCISIHISKIHELENKLLSIDEKKYNEMFEYYHKIKYLFELEGMTKQIIQDNI